MLMSCLQELSEGSAAVEGQEMELSSLPTQVAEVSTSGRSHILVSAISADGTFLVLGDASELQILQLSPAGE